MKKLLLLLTLLTVLPLCGCQILNRDYISISPHLEQKSDDEQADTAFNVSTYSGLKSAILRLVELGQGEGTVRLYNYTGDVDRDLLQACSEAANEDPLGAYAVGSMSYQHSRVLTYHEATVNITYRRTPEQIAAVATAGNAAEYRQALRRAVENFEPEFVAQVPYYSESQFDVSAFLTEQYYTGPLDIPVLPTFSLSLYPDSGPARILEVQLNYGDDVSELTLRRDEIRAGARDITSGLGTLEEAGKLEAVHTALRDTVGHLEDRDDAVEGDFLKDDTFTAYGALVQGEAVSEGYALAFKALCDLMDIECRVVRGRLDGLPHCWNIVTLGEQSYHVDTALDDLHGGTGYFLRGDPFMASTHRWVAESYPVCPEDYVREDVSVAGLTEEDSGESE